MSRLKEELGKGRRFRGKVAKWFVRAHQCYGFIAVDGFPDDDVYVVVPDCGVKELFLNDEVEFEPGAQTNPQTNRPQIRAEKVVVLGKRSGGGGRGERPRAGGEERPRRTSPEPRRSSSDRRRTRSPEPPKRRSPALKRRDESPDPRRRNESPEQRRRRSREPRKRDESPGQRRRRSPEPRRRDASPDHQRRRDKSPEARRRREASPDHQQRRRDKSPERAPSVPKGRLVGTIETWCNKEPNSYGFVLSDRVKGQIFAPSHNFLAKVRDSDVAAGKTRVEFHIVRGVRKQDDVMSEWKAERIRILGSAAPPLSSSSSSFSSSSSAAPRNERGDRRERSPERRHRKDSPPRRQRSPSRRA